MEGLEDLPKHEPSTPPRAPQFTSLPHPVPALAPSPPPQLSGSQTARCEDGGKADETPLLEPSAEVGPPALSLDEEQEVWRDLVTEELHPEHLKTDDVAQGGHASDLVKPEIIGGALPAIRTPSPPPPPPPPPKSAADLGHVDVDLGPLKSVSRNHARIEFNSHLGQFCIVILGRNGAWVDNRFYIKGATVPLEHWSQVQIATRIFSFILPPSADRSPSLQDYSPGSTAAYEDLPYPYNLPPENVGYEEFYGEPGPGPSTALAAHMAGRIPPPFNAFKAMNGYGMPMMRRRRESSSAGSGASWDSWDEDEELDSDSDGSEDSDDDDEDDEDGEEGDEGEEEEEEEDDEEEEESTRPRPKIRLKLTSKKAHDESDLSSLSDDNEHAPKKRGKSSKVAKSKKAQKEESDEDEEEVVSKRGGPRGKYATKGKAKKAKQGQTEAVEDEQDVSIEKPKKKGKVDKMKEEQEDSSPAGRAPGTAGKRPAAKKKPKGEPSETLASLADGEMTPDAQVPVANGDAAKIASSSAPTAAGAAVSAAAAGGNQSAPNGSARPNGTPTSQAATQANLPASQRSLPVVSVQGGPPMAPFYCTELKETPGRPGHVVVNVPIPPSGAGPRPPPGPMLGLDGKIFIGPSPLKPDLTFASIIHRALKYLPRGRGTLGEVCNWVAGEWEWFRMNVDSGWPNSIRHNLSLNKAFLKVPRIAEDDPESKGSVWIIDPHEGPLFEEKQRRDAVKMEGKAKNVHERRERDRQRAEDRARAVREAHIAEQVQRPAVPPPAPRQLPVPARARPPAPTNPSPANPASAATAQAKAILPPKTKVAVSVVPLTPALRQKSVITTTDTTGNPLPFACDGTTLYLDQQTFGHLTADIINKLTLLGASAAIEVISAWYMNKNKSQAQRQAQAAAQAKAGQPGATAVRPVVPGAVNGVRNGVNGGPVVRPPGVPLRAPGAGPVRPGIAGAPGARPPAPGAPGLSKPTPTGPAPPGATLTQVITMIAAVANAKGDVNQVGPNASALLKYIRVVGAKIDLKVAEKIWATGVLPPLPAKKPLPSGGGSPSPAPSSPAVITPAAAVSAQSAAGATPSPMALKRKLDGDGPAGAASSAPPSHGSADVEGGDAKKPKLEASAA